MTDELDTQTARLFFALWPDGRTRGALAQAADKLQRRCGGKATRVQTIHLTLVFLGDVPVARIGELGAAMEGLCSPAFGLEINRLGWWKHNRIAWAAPAETPPQMGELVEEIRRRLVASGFRFDAKRFVPHITLARKAQCAEQAFFPLAVAWRAKDFVLVRSVVSEAGAAYEIIGRWGLQT
ncbi:MAG: RNA 2',3'-cyclic phosphodiesterase [Sulfuricella sp.]|nr:RNA 2',3'-cyclic phosphodiesterase [Sulfuricella sp.]